MDWILTPIRAAIGPYLLWIKLALAAALVLAIAWLWADRADLRAANAVYSANAEIDQAALTSATQALDDINKDHARQMAAVVADLRTARQRAARTALDLETINHAANDDDRRPGGAGAALDAVAVILLQRASGRGADHQGGAADDRAAAAGRH